MPFANETSELEISPEREAYVKDRIGWWEFPAHEFTDDELVFGACEMLQHAFRMPELEQWRLSSSELRTFLLACRAAYNSFVLYHNFRHAIDVLQSVFCFLLHIGALPPRAPVLQSGAADCSSSKSTMAALLSPFDTLTLLIAAIGHDVGHPGVNNFFLVKLNAPLAQLYNDNSVLEAFHCAAFSQILRRHWPAAFQDKQLRKLLISSILATDMGVHQKFMERLGSLQERFHESNRSTMGWKPQDVEMYKTLLCGLLIKCADISNVARPWDVAESWTKILQEEFANQGEMEKEVGMETALFGGPPELGNVYKLATGQIGFMSIFAIPLFEGVSDILPQLRFTVEQIRSNQSRWHYYADREKRRQSLQQRENSHNRSLDHPSTTTTSTSTSRRRRYDDGDDEESRSPRSQSPAASFKTSRSVPAKDAIETPQLADGILAATHQEAEELYGAETVAQTTIRRKPTMHEGEEDYFGPVSISGSTAMSARTASPSGYNEATISPVVSPDTPGPSMDITGSTMPPPPPGFVGQRATGGGLVPGMQATMAMGGGASGGLPGSATAAAASASAGTEGSDIDLDSHNRMEPLPGAFDRNRLPTTTDGSALASWVFANSSRHPQQLLQQQQQQQEEDSGESLPVSPGDPRPPSSRHNGSSSYQQQQRRPHANTNSSTRTSGLTNSQRNSCTRTQSVSTYSNNMTPISPATNATSFLTVDSASVDDDDDDDKKSAGSLSRSERDPAGSSTRPSTSDPCSGELDCNDNNNNNNNDGQQQQQQHQHMTVPMGKKSSYSSRSMTGGNDRPSSSPPPSSTMTPRSDPGYSPYEWHYGELGSPGQQQRSPSAFPPPPPAPPQPQQNEGEAHRRLPKKRSRLRLAFWRRRNHNSHQQEVGGDF